MRRNLLIKLAAAAVVFSTTTGAFATDEKDYPGTVCFFANGEVAPNLYGSVYNPYLSADVDLMCPLVRDATNIDYTYVRVIDHGTTNDRASCTINAESTYLGGFAGDWYSNQTSGSSDNWQLIPLFSLDTYDYYYLTCTLPHQYFGTTSYLNNISVVED